jgi:hypothetical protein
MQCDQQVEHVWWAAVHQLGHLDVGQVDFVATPGSRRQFQVS